MFTRFSVNASVREALLTVYRLKLNISKVHRFANTRKIGYGNRSDCSNRTLVSVCWLIFRQIGLLHGKVPSYGKLPWNRTTKRILPSKFAPDSSDVCSEPDLSMSRDLVFGDGVRTCSLSLVSPTIDIRHMICNRRDN